MSLDEQIRSSISRAGIVRVRNALNPLLWGSAVIPALSWAAAFALRDDKVLEYFMAILGSLPILGLMVAYFMFLFRDPDRLQSEEFVLKQRELLLIEHKSKDMPEVPTDAVDLTAVLNPSSEDRSGHEP